MMEQLQELCRMLDKYNVKHGSVDPMTAPALCRKLKVVAKHDVEAMLIIAGIQTYLSDKDVTSENPQPGVQTITVKRHVAVAEKVETKQEGTNTMDNVTVGLTQAQQVGVRRIADEVFIFSKIGKLPITPAVSEQLVAEFGDSILRYEQRAGTSAAAADIIDVGADIIERDAIIDGVTELTARLLLNPVDADLILAKYVINRPAPVTQTGVVALSAMAGDAPKAEVKKVSFKERILKLVKRERVPGKPVELINFAGAALVEGQTTKSLIEELLDASAATRPTTVAA